MCQIWVEVYIGDRRWNRTTDALPLIIPTLISPIHKSWITPRWLMQSNLHEMCSNFTHDCRVGCVTNGAGRHQRLYDAISGERTTFAHYSCLNNYYISIFKTNRKNQKIVTIRVSTRSPPTRVRQNQEPWLLDHKKYTQQK